MIIFDDINQSEVSRVSELIPEALRSDAHTLVGLLEEYYRYMSTVDLPSHLLNSLDENYSLDEVSEEYLPKIKQYIAPYVPNSSIMTDRQLYTKVVKYFYNARGSRESALVFFKIFFGNIDTEIFDMTNTSSGISAKWIPYTYGIKTDIPISEWEIPYRALVHPVGFRFFAYLLFVFYSQNKYDLTAISNLISNSPEEITKVEKYFGFKTSAVNNDISYSLLGPDDNLYSNPLKIKNFAYGSHTPTYQPGWFEYGIRTLFFLFTNASSPYTDYNYTGTYFDASLPYTGVALSYEKISQIALLLFQSTYLNSNHHLQNLRDEYRAENKFRDPSVIASFMGYTIENAEVSLWDANSPAQFQNVGSYFSFKSTGGITVTGAGTGYVNGSYTDQGDNPLVPGYNYYKNSNSVYLYRSAAEINGAWIFSTSIDGSTPTLYESGAGFISPWGITFTVTDGTPPAPTVTLA